MIECTGPQSDRGPTHSAHQYRRSVRSRRPTRFWAALALAVATVAVSTVSAHDSTLAGAPPVDPTPSAPLSGEPAIRALGGDVDEVAAEYDMSAAELVHTLRNDPSLFVDADQQLLYVEPPLPSPAEADTIHDEPHGAPGVASGADAPTLTELGGYTGTTATAGLTAGQVFGLASRPSAPITVYLDFTGHTVSGTAWNANYGPAVISVPSPTTTPGVFTQNDLDEIVEVWSRVAEDFAAFDVNVTTAEPAPAKLTMSNYLDTEYGTRVVIGPNTFFPANVGGVAYVGPLGLDYYMPAFVFTGTLPGRGKFVAEAASHEVGHNFGLRHDGTASLEYYGGHGSWAPIMGVGYSRPVTQWSKGEYTGANRTEDDVAVIAGWGGFADDVEGSPAAPYAPGPLPVQVSGVVSTRTDVDAFQVSTAGGLHVALASRSHEANLDASVDVVDSGGNVVATFDPAGAAPITAYRPVPAGQYQVRVDGVGHLGPLAGYSDYGSLGAYTLAIDAGRAPTVSATATRLATTIRFDATASDADGDALTYSWTFSNGAPAVTGASATIPSTGSVIATVTVTDTSGLSATARVVISDANAAPTAVVTPSVQQGTAPLTVTFDASGSVDPDGDTLTRQWSFSDTGVDESTAASVTRTFTEPGTYTATVTVTDPFGETSSASASVVVSWPTPSTTMQVGQTSGYTAVPPLRIADSRTATGIRRLDAGVTRRLVVAGRNGIPSDATAIAANLTAVRTTGAGTVSAHLCGTPATTYSGAWSAAGQRIGTGQIITLDGTGSICLTATATTDVVVDVTGWFSPTSSGRFNPITPVRVADSRTGSQISSKVTAGRVVGVSVAGRASVPAGARAAVLTVTVSRPADRGYVTLYACGATRPSTWSISFGAGESRSNQAWVRLGSTGTRHAGRVCIRSTADAHIAIDVSGWIGRTGRRLQPVDPLRLVDTRLTSPELSAGTRGAPLPAGDSLEIRASDVRGLPTGTAAAMNITALGHTSAATATGHPSGSTAPAVPTLVAPPRRTTVGGAQVMLARSRLSLTASVRTHLVVDVVGVWR